MTRRLILNADDYGYDPAVTQGIVAAMTRGLVSSTTMMVNTPSSADAAARAQGLAVGLHLNLARFNALSTGEPLDEADAHRLAPDFVERETLAQLDRLRALLGREATHLDVHKHLHRHAPVLEGVARAATRRNLPVRSIDERMRARLRELGVTTNDVLLGDAGTEAYWTLERFKAQLDDLPAGGVVELMCHPGYAPVTLSSGYAHQREVELATFTSLEAQRWMTERKLSFSSW